MVVSFSTNISIDIYSVYLDYIKRKVNDNENNSLVSCTSEQMRCLSSRDSQHTASIWPRKCPDERM